MEVLLYSDIQSQTASDFIHEVNAISDDELTVRVSCNGGDVLYGWGVIAKFREFKGVKRVKIDGKARSMAAFLPCYTDDVTALDVSDFVLHRAAYPDRYEQSMSTEGRLELLRINNHLEDALRAKVDVEKFESITGTTLAELFSLETRIDVSLTASQALEVGLINEIIKITPDKKQKIEARTLAIAAKYEGKLPNTTATVADKSSNNNQDSKIIKMNIEKLKTDHPDVYAQAVAKGVSEERDRVGSWATFNSIDPVAVVAGIKSGEAISQTAMAEFSMKAMAGKQIEKIEKESAKETPTATVESVELTETEKIEAAAMALVMKPKTV